MNSSRLSAISRFLQLHPKYLLRYPRVSHLNNYRVLSVDYHWHPLWSRHRSLPSIFDHSFERPILPSVFWNDPFFFSPLPLTEPRTWTQRIDLHGFKKEYITTNRETIDGKSVLKIHAIQKGDHGSFSEIRRSLPIPEDVDADKLDIIMNEEGTLVIRAPFKESDSKIVKYLWSDSNTSSKRLPLFGNPRVVKDEKFDGHKFVVDLDITGFEPGDISVFQRGNRIVVEAKKESVSTGDNISSYRHMKREFGVPDGVQIDEIVSLLRDNGSHLRLEAPYHPPKESHQNERKIEIQKEPDSISKKI